MHTAQTDPDLLIQALDEAIPDKVWLRIIILLSITGVADTIQLQKYVGLERGIFKRRLDKLLVSSLDGEPLVSEIEHSIKRPTEANRPAGVIKLEKGGERLLKRLGYKDARACELKEDTAILHALCMLKVYLLLAEQKEKGYTLIVDQALPYGVNRYIRPDILVLSPEGEGSILEIEQLANLKLLPRMIESLANRNDFYKADRPEKYFSFVLMIINVKDGKPFHDTIKVWTEAIRQYTKTNGPLHYRIAAIPLQKFIQKPEWHGVINKDWKILDSPDEQDEQSPEENTIKEMSAAIRPARSGKEDVVLLQALGHTLYRSLDNQLRCLSDDILFVVRAIHEGSYPKDNLYYDDAAGIPIISVYLLAEYLKIHPELMKILRRRMHFNRSRIVWTQQNILHRMGIVIRAFMGYHGWAVNKFKLDAYAIFDRERGEYVVVVTIESLPEGLEYDGYHIKRSLQWVLQALFEYGEDIGIGRPEFW